MKKILLLACFVLVYSIASAQATLPLSRTDWTGAQPLGWIGTGTGSYTSGFACSGNNGGRMDDTNDRYIVNFNAAPDQLTYVLKISGNATSSVLVEESADGIAYSQLRNVSALTTTCTSYSDNLNALSRFVRWTYTKASQNVTIDDVIITAASVAGNQAPVITDIIQSPSGISVIPTSMVTVSAMVVDDLAVNAVTLRYDVSPMGGAFDGTYDNSIPMAASGSDYTATIPMQAAGSVVYYEIEATDANMPTNASTTTSQFQYTVNTPITIPDLIITEVADPVTSAGRFVEIYNNGTTPIDLTAESIFFAVQFNGGTINSTALTGTIAPSTYYVIGNASNLQAQYGIIADFNYGTVNGNGDDGYYLYVGGDENTGLLFDAYGVLGTDGTNQPWEYTDSQARRNSISDTPTAVWAASSWTITSGDLDIMTPGTGEPTTYIYDGTNWSPANPSGVSTNGDNIVISSGSIAFTGDVDARNVTIAMGANLDMGANALNLTRNLTVNGSLDASGATLNLAGTQLQTIAGNEFSLENLILNNGSGLTVNAPINLEGVLTLTNGAITTNDNLTFKSTASTTAAVAPVVSGSVSGNVTVEQFYPAMRAYRFFSSPVNMSGTILSNWQQNGLNPGDAGYEAAVGTHITGGTLANGFDQSGSNANSAFTFNNASQLWTALPNTNTTLIAGDAVRVFVRGDRSTDLFSANVAPSNTTIKTTGSLATGNVTYTNLGANANEFSFLGNPYVAQVDMVQVMGATGTQDVNKQFYYAWDPTIAPQGAYVTYDLNAFSSNNMTSAVSQFLQPGQSFFVETLEDGGAAGLTPAVTFQEAFKSTDVNTTATYSTPSASDRIVLSLFNNADQSLKARDGVVVYFDTTGNNGIDQNDARKLQNLNVNMGIVVNGTTLSIESRAFPVVNEELALDLNQLTTGNYSFQALVDWNSTLNAVLIDRATGVETVLNVGNTTVNFDVDTTQAVTIAANRFFIKFTDGTLSTGDVAFAEAVQLYPNPTNGENINISGLSLSGDVSVEIHNISGQRVFSKLLVPSNGKLTIDNLPNLNNGVYLLRLTQNNNVALRKMLKN